MTYDDVSNRLYIGNACKSLFAIDPDSAEIVWRTDVAYGIFLGSPTCPAICGDVVVGRANWAGTYGYDSKTGKTKYVDAIELAFYNAYLAGIGRDGKWGARGVRSHGYYHVSWHGQSGLKHQHCCVNNMPRCAVDVARTMVAHDADGILHIAFYNDGMATIGGDEVEISGNYPVGEKVLVKLNRKRAGKIRFRIPNWSAGDSDRGSWRTVEAPAGESVYQFSFDLRPRIHSCCATNAKMDGGRKSADDWETKMWAAYGSNKGIEQYMRTSPAVKIMRGPLVLAKAEIVGTPESEMISHESIHGSSRSAGGERTRRFRR